MARASTGKSRGVGSRIGLPLKILVGGLLVLLILIILNAFALNNETESAELTVPGAELVETTSGQLQVLDTGEPKDAAIALPPGAGASVTGAQRIPIVLIHGSAGAINWWDDLIPLLESNHRVIAIDMLGYGGSDKPDSDYSIETQANLVAQVMSKLKVPPAVVVGHSLGGKVVTSVAERSPDLVEGLVLIDTAPDSSFGGLSGGARASRTPLLGQALWRIAPDAMVRRNVSQGFAPDYDVPDKYVEDVRAMTYPAYKKSAEEGEKYTEDESLPDRLTAVDKPLMVIFGAEDQIYDAREALSEYAAIPNAETLLIPVSGHSPQVEAPEETAAAIEGFTLGIAEEQAAKAASERAARRAKARARAKAAKAKAKAAKAKIRAARQAANSKTEPRPQQKKNPGQQAQAGNQQGNQ